MRSGRSTSTSREVSSDENWRRSANQRITLYKATEGVRFSQPYKLIVNINTTVANFLLSFLNQKRKEVYFSFII